MGGKGMVSRSLTFIAPIAALVISVGSAVGQQAAAPECRHLDYRGNFRLNGAQQHILQAKLHFIPGCGHAPNIERPEALSRIVEEFLRENFSHAYAAAAG